jgi:hypothetical protein
MLKASFIKILNTYNFVLLIVPLCVREERKKKFCVKLKNKKNERSYRNFKKYDTSSIRSNSWNDCLRANQESYD